MIYLGTIVAPSGSSANNTTTATPFTIYPTYPRVAVVTPTASGVTFHVAVGTGSSLAATTDDLGVAEQTTSQFQCPAGNPNATVVAIRGAGGSGSCQVYGLYGPAQS